MALGLQAHAFYVGSRVWSHVLMKTLLSIEPVLNFQVVCFRVTNLGRNTSTKEFLASYTYVWTSCLFLRQGTGSFSVVLAGLELRSVFLCLLCDEMREHTCMPWALLLSLLSNGLQEWDHILSLKLFTCSIFSGMLSGCACRALLLFLQQICLMNVYHLKPSSWKVNSSLSQGHFSAQHYLAVRHFGFTRFAPTFSSHSFRFSSPLGLGSCAIILCFQSSSHSTFWHRPSIRSISECWLFFQEKACGP